jgi:N6-L-threonylcarbamoyladenine synthase
MRILAIETSCDDTGIAILESNSRSQPKILADLVSSQVKIHAPWGGVVPMLAKREHQKNLVPILEQGLKETDLLALLGHSDPANAGEESLANASTAARIRGKSFGLRLQDDNTLKTILNREPELLKKIIPFLKKYQRPDIDLIAVTIGPGLEPALWVGVNFARALAYVWNLPIAPINHLEAHLGAALAFGTERKSSAIPKNLFPAVCLIVSGGHTQLILMRDFGEYRILGETRDDAAGEAFDKVAKMLNLGYPGGPIISQIANRQSPIAKKISLPRPMINTKDFDFSFSGLKTAALYLTKKLTKAQLKNFTPAIAAEFQQAIVDVLVAKTIRAAKEFKAKTVLLAGGVASNNLLRNTLSLATNHLSLNFLVPPKNFCTDNAAMVAYTAYLEKTTFEKKYRFNWKKIKADANLTIA